jgi:hypothetical protein
VAACQSQPTSQPCLIEPAPNPQTELDTGIPAPQYPGIVIHTDDSLPQLTGTMLRMYLEGCFIIHKSPNVPNGIESKKPTEFEKFDKVMSGLLAVPYKELQEELAKDRKKKARKKRAKKSRESDVFRDSRGEA